MKSKPITAEEQRRLVWKYFWEQKREEFMVFIRMAWLVLNCALIVGLLGFTIILATGNTNGTGADSKQVIPTPWVPVVIYGDIIFFGFWVIYGMILWIKSNWDYAKKRVQLDFKMEKSK